MKTKQQVIYLYHGLLRLRDEFEFNSLQSKTAFKSASACTLAVWVALLLDIPDAFWAGITALVVLKPHIGATIERSWSRLLGSILGAILGMIVVSLFADSPCLFLASLFIIVTLGLAESSQAKNQYAWILGIATFLMVTLSTFYNPYGAINTAFFRCFEILIGIISAWIVSILFFPVYSIETYNQLIKETLNQFNQISNCFFNDYKNKKFDKENFIIKYKKFKTILSNQLSIHAFLRFEKSQSIEKFNVLINLYTFLSLSVEIIYKTYLLNNNNNNSNSGMYSDEELNNIKKYFNSIIENLYNLINNNKNNFNTLSSSIEKLKIYIIKINSKQKGIKNKITESVIKNYQIMLSMEELSRSFDIINRISIEKKNKKSISYIDYFKSIFKDNIAIKYGVKGAIAMLTVPLVWVWWNLPGLSQIAVSVIAVFQLDLIATYKKGLLRIQGCFIGAITVILLLGLDVQNTATYLLIIFIVLLGFNYVHYADESINYFGTQASVAYLVGITATNSPILLISPALERLAGIIMGVLVSVLISSFLWPFTTKDAISKQIQKINPIYSSIIIYLKEYLSDSKYQKLFNYYDITKKFNYVRESILNIKISINDNDVDENINYEAMKDVYRDLYRVAFFINFFTTDLFKVIKKMHLDKNINSIFNKIIYFIENNYSSGSEDLLSSYIKLNELHDSFIDKEYSNSEDIDNILILLSFINYLKELIKSIVSVNRLENKSN